MPLSLATVNSSYSDRGTAGSIVFLELCAKRRCVEEVNPSMCGL